MHPVFIALALAVVAVVCWLLFGPGPRRSRALSRAQRFVTSGSWQEALHLLGKVKRTHLSARWQTRLQEAEAAAHQRAADEALQKRNFEEALSHLLEASNLQGNDEAEPRARVGEQMLAEVRRQFATAGKGGSAEAVLQLLQQTVGVLTHAGSPSPPCPEAAFWRGLCHVRLGQTEDALQALTTAHEESGKQMLDPALYLGILLHRLGRPQEALRYLAEANRVDGSCPLVTWQMGVSLVAAGGDSGLALRALQKAVGPRGLSIWLSQPDKMWVEAFPQDRSYVRRLASKQRYTCPLLGSDLDSLIRQGQLALAQAHYRQERFVESAQLFGKLLQDSPPTTVLLRGYGLALARQKQYDEAYKHLRSALEQDPRDAMTAGYLALCGALGKPTQAQDKPKNVNWAIRLISRYQVTEDPEWADLLSTVFTEAFDLQIPVAAEDLLLLCNAQASVQATDPRAAAGYARLASTAPEAIRPVHAWLYTWAAAVHRLHLPGDLELFARTFRDANPAREFFARHKWDFGDAEFAYLARVAAESPGHFPEALGPAYEAEGQKFLLERSRQAEAAGHPKEARRCAEVLLQLAPASAEGHDRLACLLYREGDLEKTLDLLNRWQRLTPASPLPFIRQAILEQEGGNSAGRAQAIVQALQCSHGRYRGAIAYLGARLSLRDAHPSLDQAADLLKICLQEDSDHVEGLWCLAAVLSLQGDKQTLASLGPRLDRPEVKDPRFHFMGAVCCLAAGDYPRVMEMGRRAAAEGSLAIESHYVVGLALEQLKEIDSARRSWRHVAQAESSPSAANAKARLAQLGFIRGDFGDAVAWWTGIKRPQRTAWQLDGPLQQTVLLAGLQAIQEERFETAAELFREAGKQGLRDRRLGGLIAFALVKAAQRLLYGQELGAQKNGALSGRWVQAAQFLDRAAQSAGQDANVHYLLALANKRLGKTKEARDAFRKITRPDANVLLQMGLLSFIEGNLVQAEGEFVRAWEMDRGNYEAAHNLALTYLTLGKLDQCSALLPQTRELASQRGDRPANERQLLAGLQALLHICHKEEGDRQDSYLTGLNPQDELRLLKFLRNLGRLDTSLLLLRALADSRPRSEPAREAFVEVLLVKAKDLVDRCNWTGAELLLRPLANEKLASRAHQAALFNLLGCSACLTQDFDGAKRSFQSAEKLIPNDLRIQQNLALNFEFRGELQEADPHWNRFFDFLGDHAPVPPEPANYLEVLAYESLMRLANRYADNEKWQMALSYVQRAQKLRPSDTDTLERLFHLYQQAKRPGEARRTLDNLRRLNPSEPQYDLYELDLLEVRGLSDIDKLLSEIERIRKRYPGDARVDERAVNMVGNVIPLMGDRCDQLTDQMSKVVDQVRNLPNYQINWAAVREAMRDLIREFQKLRKITGKCLTLVATDEHRRVVRDLAEHIDRKIEACRSMGA
jgi:tetratricopeptide (TPR) repeat protein